MRSEFSSQTPDGRPLGGASGLSAAAPAWASFSRRFLALGALALWIMALATPPSAASAAPSPLGGGGGPISISADHMTADQNSRLVTFTGRVIARQDDLIITCDLMRVHYQPVNSPPQTPEQEDEVIKGQAGGVPAPPPQSAETAGPAAGSEPSDADDPYAETPAEGLAEASSSEAAASNPSSMGDPLGGGQEIYRVDCEGSVRVQQRDKLAVGQKALYLAKSKPRRLILTGDARIWEGANAITGHQVVYYLDENRSHVESRDNQRVRAFYDQDGKRRGDKASDSKTQDGTKK